MAASVKEFVSGKGSVEGARLPKRQDEPVSFDAERFMKLLDTALGGGNKEEALESRLA